MNPNSNLPPGCREADLENSIQYGKQFDEVLEQIHERQDMRRDIAKGDYPDNSIRRAILLKILERMKNERKH